MIDHSNPLDGIEFGPVFNRPYTMTSRLGDRRDYSRFGGRPDDKHEGADYMYLDNPAETTEIVNCVYPGTVESLRSLGGYGLRVRTKCFYGETEFLLYYAHLKEFLCMPNQMLDVGDPIGVVGNTGNSNGTHLHLSLQVPNLGRHGFILKDIVDPDQYFPNHPHTIGGFIIPW